jgi:tRNA(adenine34) deaminase
MAIGMQDPVLGEATMRELRSNIKNCPEPMLIAQGGHFVQEHGEAIARQAIDLFL